MSRIPVSSQNKFKKESRKRRNADLNLSASIPDTADINSIIAQYLIDNPIASAQMGTVDFTGAAVSLPAGWSSAKISSGVYEVTFDSAKSTPYNVVVCCGATFTRVVACPYSKRISTKFEVNSYVPSTNGLADSDFSFIMTDA